MSSFSDLIIKIDERMNLPFRKFKYMFSDRGNITYMCLKNWREGKSKPSDLLEELLLDRLESYDDIRDLVEEYRKGR